MRSSGQFLSVKVFFCKDLIVWYNESIFDLDRIFIDLRGDDMATKTSVYLDEQSMNAARELPRKANASALLRWLLKLVSTTDNEWKKLIKEDREIKEVQDYIRPMLMKALGLKDKD